MAPWKPDLAIDECLGRPVVIGRRFFATLAQLDVVVTEKKLVVFSEDQEDASASCVPRLAPTVSSAAHGLLKCSYHMLCVRLDNVDNLAAARETSRELRSSVKLGDSLEWTEELQEKLLAGLSDSMIFGAYGTADSESGRSTVEVQPDSLKVAEERVWDMSTIDKIRRQRYSWGSSQGAATDKKPGKSKSKDSGRRFQETGVPERALVLKQDVDANLTTSCSATTPSTAPPSPGTADTDVEPNAGISYQKFKLLANPKLVRRPAGPPVSADAAAFCDWLHNGPMQRILGRLKNFHDREGEKLNSPSDGVNNKDPPPATVSVMDMMNYTEESDSGSMAPGSSLLSSQRGSILDVAGGKGELSSLLLEAGIPGRALHIVDPKESAGGLSRARRRWLRKQGISEPMGVVKEYFQVQRGEGDRAIICAEVTTPQNHAVQELVQTAANGHLRGDSARVSHPNPLNLVPDYMDRLAGASPLVLGLHPDQATDDIVDYCVSRRKPFAVVPCCVFGRQFPLRRYWEYVAADGNSSLTSSVNSKVTANHGLGPAEVESGRVKRYFPVYSRPQLIRYLVQKHPGIKTDVLENCAGANVVVYCTFEDAEPGT